MKGYSWVMVSGLLWAGSVWAESGGGCADVGAVADLGIRLRAHGVDAAHLARMNARPPGPVEQALPEDRRAALRAAQQIGYFSTDTPEATRAHVEALCRAGGINPR